MHAIGDASSDIDLPETCAGFQEMPASRLCCRVADVVIGLATVAFAGVRRPEIGDARDGDTRSLRIGGAEQLTSCRELSPKLVGRRQAGPDKTNVIRNWDV